MSRSNIEKFVCELKTNKTLLEEYKNLVKTCRDKAEFHDKLLKFSRQKGYEFTEKSHMDFWEGFCTHKSPNDLSENEFSTIAGGINPTKAIRNMALSAFGFIQIFMAASPTIAGHALETSQNLPSASFSQNTKDKQNQGLNFLDFFKNNPNLDEISSESPYNEVDALLFSTLVYLPMIDDLKDSNMSLSDFANSCIKTINENLPIDKSESHTLYKFQNLSSVEKRFSDIFELLKTVSTNSRYKNIKIGDAKLNFGKNGQFAAVTFTLPDGTKVVTFRGTDGTVSGWKENVDMAWSDEVLAQKDAASYLEEIATKYSDAKLAVTGHSKGGHLSFFSSFLLSKKNESAAKRILSIDNFDGPGIRNDFIEKDKEVFDRIKGIVRVFTPQDSLIATLFSNNFQGGVSYTYVKSSKFLIMQHDNFSWSVSKDAMKKDTKEKLVLFENNGPKAISKLFEQVCKTVLSRLSNEQIRLFSDALFKIAGSEDPTVVVLQPKNIKLENLLKLSTQELTNFIEVASVILKSIPDSVEILDSNASNEVISLAKAESIITENENLKKKINNKNVIKKADNSKKSILSSLFDILVTCF